MGNYDDIMQLENIFLEFSSAKQKAMTNFSMETASTNNRVNSNVRQTPAIHRDIEWKLTGGRKYLLPISYIPIQKRI
jgi:hypothetical protein